MYLPIIEAAVVLATEGLKLLNKKEATKYIDEINDIMKDLQDEVAKNQLADDAKIMHLQGRLKIEMETCRLNMFTNATTK